jgi:1-acyl-sn-glycerol-3-phosphate acyltransferase
MNREKLIFNFQRILMSGYARALINFDVEMEEALPPAAKIVIANHPTTTDPFLLPLFTKEPFSILVSQLAFDLPLLGWALRGGGHIPVPDRKNGSGEKIIAAAVEKLRLGRSVAVFPEGLLSPEVGQFHPPKSGAARIALLSGAPVVPVGIHLSRKAYLPIKIKAEGRLAWRGDYYVTVGRPLAFSGDPEDHGRVREVSRQMLAAIIGQAEKSARRMREAYLQRVPELMPAAVSVL